jgi:hypothetical protein
MFTDKGIFSNAQTLAASSAENSTNTLDTEVASSNLGAGTPIWLVVRVNTTFTNASAGGTETVSLQSSAASASGFAANLTGPTVTVGVMVKGLDLLTVPLPADHLRYLKVVYTPASCSGWTAGAVDAFLTTASPLN